MVQYLYQVILHLPGCYKAIIWNYWHFGPRGCPKMSVTNYQSAIHNIPEEHISFTLQQKLEMQQPMLVHLLQCLNIYHFTHTHYCILFRAKSFQPNFPLVSHRMLLYIHFHRLVHLGSQTKILYVNLTAQFGLTGHRLISSVLECLKVFKMFLLLWICSGTMHSHCIQ